MDAIEQFKGAMRAHGLAPPEIIADGRLHRFTSNGRRGDDAGWYLLHGDCIPAGCFGDWRTGFSKTWRADIGRDLTPAEMAAHQARVDAARRARDADEEARRRAAAKTATAIWKAAQPAPHDHHYLTRKQTQAYGARLYHGPLVVAGMPCDGSLIVPACDGSGAIHTLLFIDGNTKRFLSGGDPRGCYFSIGTMEDAGSLCLCEGFAGCVSRPWTPRSRKRARRWTRAAGYPFKARPSYSTIPSHGLRSSMDLRRSTRYLERCRDTWPFLMAPPTRWPCGPRIPTVTKPFCTAPD